MDDQSSIAGFCRNFCCEFLSSGKTIEDLNPLDFQEFAFFLRLLISMRRQHHRVQEAPKVEAEVEDDARSEASAASAASVMDLLKLKC